MATAREKTGVAIVLVSALGGALGLVFTHVSLYVGSGIAIVGILIGTGVARGKFSAAHQIGNKTEKPEKQ